MAQDGGSAAPVERLEGQIINWRVVHKGPQSTGPVKPFETTLAELRARTSPEDALLVKTHPWSSHLKSYFVTLDHKAGLHDPAKCFGACLGVSHGLLPYCRFCKTAAGKSPRPAFMLLYNHLKEQQCEGLKGADLQVFLAAIAKIDAKSTTCGLAAEVRKSEYEQKRASKARVPLPHNDGTMHQASDEESGHESDDNWRERTADREQEEEDRGAREGQTKPAGKDYHLRVAAEGSASTPGKARAVPALVSSVPSKRVSSSSDGDGPEKRRSLTRSQSNAAKTPSNPQSSKITGQPDVVIPARARAPSTSASIAGSTAERASSVESTAPLFPPRGSQPAAVGTTLVSDPSTSNATVPVTRHPVSSNKKTSKVIDLSDEDDDRKPLSDLPDCLLPGKPLLAEMGETKKADLAWIENAEDAESYAHSAYKYHPAKFPGTGKVPEFVKALKKAM